MATFLIATMAIPGHVAPFAPVARELTARGHRVIWYTSRFYQTRVEATGAIFKPIVSAVDFGDADYNRHYPARAQTAGLQQVVFDFVNLFVGSAEGHYHDLRAIIADEQPDVLLSDSAVIGAYWIGTRGAIPHALLNITTMHFPSRELAPFGLGIMPDGSLLGQIRNRALDFLANTVMFRPINQAHRAAARKYGIPASPVRPTPAPHLTMQPSIPAFEYASADASDALHFIGALLPETSAFTPPEWWDEVVGADRPVVLVTQGTIATNADELIAPTLAGLADEDVLVIAATGGKTADDLGLSVPPNARVVPFVPFVPLMPHIDLYITNGGYGGVMIALAHGVPMIGAGTTEDKVEVNNRIARAGVGINLRTATPTPEQVRSAARTILNEARYRQRAKAMGAALAQHDAPRAAADLLETLARTKQPVRRGAPIQWELT
jgi:MGT family glycosyltransferase